MNKSYRYLFAISVGATLATAGFAADIPRLDALYYGRVLNTFGYPCAAVDGVRVSAKKINGTEVAYYDIGSVIGPGINYRLQVNVVASGTGSDGLSVPEGGTIQIQATIGGQPVYMIGTTNIAVSSGAVRNFSYILGADVNRNGIPDEWEQFVIDAMAALGMDGVTNIAQFDPSADYDGDGVSNMQEFFAGTLPFLETDSLRITEFRPDANGTFRIRFFSNQGFDYQVSSSTNLSTRVWQKNPFGTQAASPTANNTVPGAGSWQDVYVPTNGLGQFFRLLVK